MIEQKTNATTTKDFFKPYLIVTIINSIASYLISNSINYNDPHFAPIVIFLALFYYAIFIFTGVLLSCTQKNSKMLALAILNIFAALLLASG
jgi:hypothetical protein